MKSYASMASTVVVYAKDKVVMGNNSIVMDYCILGVPNAYPKIFRSDQERIVRVGCRTTIYPWAMIYEGCQVGDDCRVFERSTLGSRTIIGNRSQVMYGAQVHDQITIGEHCVIGGFVCDNSVVGNGCSIFGALVHTYDHGDTSKWDETDEVGPTIEDNVIVGWGSVIVGAITIGKGARIRPNSVVTRDVLPGVVYGNCKNSL